MIAYKLHKEEITSRGSGSGSGSGSGIVVEWFYEMWIDPFK